MYFDGKYRCSVVSEDYLTSKKYGDGHIEVSWKIRNKNDSGLYLRKEDAISFAKLILEQCGVEYDRA